MMTDEKVKKGLECCADSCGGLCRECPHDEYEDCETILAKDALALINRLEEENKDIRALCRKKSNGMRFDEWLKMIAEADGGLKLVDTNAIKEQIRKETVKEIINYLNGFDGYVGAAEEIALHFGVEVD